ncbi:IS5/IS1182 family transposase [Burkholderia ubonensis]|uniref:IS5/IS1182 family transposase n=1 Tax=Burkholderia ubonensis TaxID=101571 RepID=UPI0007580281|nr:IS5/IS1182 family transposase [Burkholderia ubonensis]KVN28040.1 hypothetical protein WJ64_00620 [Burkholderia ubonensis]
MKRQMSFAEVESAGKKRVTRRQRFLEEMEKLVPWSGLLTAIEPYYPKGTRGRPPIGLERMLRIYFLQQWYSLSDEGLEDALYDSIAMRAFAGIDLAVENVPDAGYIGVDKRDEMKSKSVKWRVAAKRGKLKAMQDGAQKDRMIALERTKAQIRARVEHPFHVVKNLFGHRKVRYKGLLKNTAQLFSLFALANLVIARNRLRSIHGGSPSCV